MVEAFSMLVGSRDSYAPINSAQMLKMDIRLILFLFLSFFRCVGLRARESNYEQTMFESRTIQKRLDGTTNFDEIKLFKKNGFTPAKCIAYDTPSKR
jgi:hypothetical protein